MRALYIGILSEGTTSKLRFDSLQRIKGDWDWEGLDTDRPFKASSRISRSLAFRLRIGGAVRAINRAVVDRVSRDQFDLIWVDKGVYLWPTTVKLLRQQAAKLVHYTPDTAFLNNHSRLFNATIDLYDLLVTTKSFEQYYYQRLVPPERVMLTTQSYDGNLHRPRCEFAEKRHEAVFVGLCEPDREVCLDQLLQRGIPVRLGGHGWGPFVRRHQNQQLLSFESERVFGDRYAEMLSQATVGLGLLTKRFGELHTTRTFEIPACGTVLATEANGETSQLFEQDEAIFFADYAELADTLKQRWQTPALFESMARADCRKCDRRATTTTP